MNILIVDDEPKDLLTASIENLGGHFVTEISNLDTALDYVREHRWSIDLIMVDEVFKNLDDDSILTSGFEFGKAVQKEMSYIPRVMFTGNAYSTEFSVDATVDGDFIDFIPKRIISNKNIREILSRISNRKGFQERRQMRIAAKKKIIIDRLKDFTNSELETLITRLSKASRVRDEIIAIGSLKIDVQEWLAGYCDIQTAGNDEIKKLLSELVHMTEKAVVYKGEWSKEKNEVRILLANYLKGPDAEAERHDIEFETFNWLMEIMSIRRSFKGEQSVFLTKLSPLSDITKECKAGKNNDVLFQHKMIARRVIIGHRKLLQNKPEALSLIVLINLLLDGATGTFTDKDTTLNQYERSFGAIPPGKEPKNVLNTCLGLTYESVKLIQQASAGTYNNSRPKNIVIPDYLVNINPPFVLYEEDQFWKRIGQHVDGIHFFLQNYDPVQFLPLGYKEVAIVTLNDLEKVLIDAKAYSRTHYKKLLEHLVAELDQLNGLFADTLEYLLKIKLR